MFIVKDFDNDDLSNYKWTLLLNLKIMKRENLFLLLLLFLVFVSACNTERIKRTIDPEGYKKAQGVKIEQVFREMDEIFKKTTEEIDQEKKVVFGGSAEKMEERLARGSAKADDLTLEACLKIKNIETKNTPIDFQLAFNRFADANYVTTAYLVSLPPRSSEDDNKENQIKEDKDTKDMIEKTEAEFRVVENVASNYGVVYKRKLNY